MRRHIRTCLFTLTILSASIPFTPASSAQEAASGSGSSSKADSPERRKPLPTYYGQIGISEEQRQQLYTVQDSYEVKLQKLRDELKALTKERDDKLESHLTAGQKSRLKELRANARQKAAERAAAAKPGKP